MSPEVRILRKFCLCFLGEEDQKCFFSSVFVPVSGFKIFYLSQNLRAILVKRKNRFIGIFNTEIGIGYHIWKIRRRYLVLPTLGFHIPILLFWDVSNDQEKDVLLFYRNIMLSYKNVLLFYKNYLALISSLSRVKKWREPQATYKYIA